MGPVRSDSGFEPKVISRAEIPQCGEPLTDPRQSVMLGFLASAAACNLVS
jgi:hypothetical protein